MLLQQIWHTNCNNNNTFKYLNNNNFFDIPITIDSPSTLSTTKTPPTSVATTTNHSTTTTSHTTTTTSHTTTTSSQPTTTTTTPTPAATTTTSSEKKAANASITNIAMQTTLSSDPITIKATEEMATGEDVTNMSQDAVEAEATTASVQN